MSLPREVADRLEPAFDLAEEWDERMVGAQMDDHPLRAAPVPVRQTFRYGRAQEFKSI